MSELLLEAYGLRKSFGQKLAVDGVSLAVEPGHAYGLVGPDGAGKTTTMRLLVGALHSEAGEVRIKGYDVREQGTEALRHVGYLAQRFSVYGDLTVAENLRFFGTVRGVPRSQIEQRAVELLSFVGLAGFERRRAEQLSGGMKQKLGLACALIHRPQVLLLDEPTTGVDPATRQDFWQLIIRLLAAGAGVVVSTPYMDEAARCGRLMFMYSGRILTEGSPRELIALLSGRVLELAARPQAVAQRVCLADPDVEAVAAFGDRLHVRLKAGAPGPAGSQVLARLTEALAMTGVQLVELRAIPPSLEDVFIALLERQRGNLPSPEIQDA